MEKVRFNSADGSGADEFFVLEETRIGGSTYLLVTDSEEDGAECFILKDTASEEALESLYEVVEDEEELNAVSRVFEELLEDVEIER